MSSVHSKTAAAMMTSCCFSSSSKITNFYDNSCRKFRIESSYRYAEEGGKKLGKLVQPTEYQVLTSMSRAKDTWSLYSSSVPEGKLMGVELIGVYKSGSINWG